MKKQVFLRWFWSLLEYLMVMPIIFILAGLTLQKNRVVLFVLVLPFHMLVSIALTALLKKFRNLGVAAVGVLYVSGVTWLWFATSMTGTIEEITLTVLATGFFFIWGIRAGIGTTSRNLFFYGGGLVIHGVALLLINRAPSLIPLKGAAMILSIVYVIAGLPFANWRFLINESHQKDSLRTIPGTVLRGNRMIILCILACILLLSIGHFLIEAVTFIAEQIAKVIGKVLAFLASLYHQPGAEPGQGGGQMLLPPAEEGNSILSIILDTLSVLLVLALLFLLIRYMVRNRKRMIRALQELLAGFFGRFQRWGTTEQGYYDRQESLLTTKTPKKPSLLKKIFKREPKWRDMKDNPSRVRFLYTRFVLENIRKGFGFSPADTPDETVARITAWNREEEKVHEPIRESYNQVRYGGESPDDATVKALKDTYL